MRLKPDGTLDLDWREVRRPWWMKAPEERRADLLEVIRRNNPELTPEEAQEMLDKLLLGLRFSPLADPRFRPIAPLPMDQKLLGTGPMRPLDLSILS